MNSLILKTTYSSPDNTGIIFNDCTPLWNLTSAPGGYDLTGANCFNPNDIDLSTVRLMIEAPYSGVINIHLLYIPDTVPDVAQVGGTGFITYKITADMLGVPSIPDGIYRCAYLFNPIGSPVAYSASEYFAVTTTLKCCLDTKLKAISICPTCEKSSKVQALFEAQMMLEQIDLLLECENYEGAQVILDYLNDFCDIKNCSSCN